MLSFDRTGPGAKRIGTHVADMDSNPTASPTSISPLRIWFATAETAIKPEEQKLRREISDLVNYTTLTAGSRMADDDGDFTYRLTIWRGTVSGIPAARAAARASYGALGGRTVPATRGTLTG